MKMRSNLAALLSIASLFACGSGAPGPGLDSSASSPSPVVGTEPFPRQIAGFKRGDSTAFGDINSGISYRYHHPSGTQVDVYRYPIAVGLVCRGECLRSIVDDEITGFKSDLPLYIRNGAMDSAEVVGASREDPPASSWLKVGRHLELRVFRSGVWNRSHLWIFGGDGIRIKLRATYPEDKPQPDYRAFISDLLNQSAPPFTCSRGPGGDDVIQIASRRGSERRQLERRILQALDSLGFERSFVGPEMGHWAAAPRFGPLEVGELRESELGLGLAVRITPVGDSLDFVVMARTLCNGTLDGGPLAVLAVAQFVNVVDGNH